MMGDPRRPLAVVMVADADPVTVANLTRLARWSDVVLEEGTQLISGESRSPLRGQWRDILGLDHERLRIVTTELGAWGNSTREAVQRNSVMPILALENPRRPVLLADGDEFLDEATVSRAIETLDEPIRLGLVPLYGAIDRVARTTHCCGWGPEKDLRDPGKTADKTYLFAGPVLARPHQLIKASPSRVRTLTGVGDRSVSFGVHATFTEPVARIAWKLRHHRHVWDPRVYEAQHLTTMLNAGVHHAGWWVAEYREPERWLVDLARDASLRVDGPQSPIAHLLGLRAWAQVRLDPRIPDELVQAGDAYASTRTADAADFLPELDDWLRLRPIEHTGHLPSSLVPRRHR
jgi:hypothetical protein